MKTALVTGASSGIGEAIARALAREGYSVYAGARRVEKMQHLTELGIQPIYLDVTDESSMVNVVQTILRDQSQIDVLVNNAGYGSYGSFEEIPLAEARAQVEVNLFGLARLTQIVIPHMRSAKSGAIINISSIGGRFGEPLGSWYHVTKYAVEGLSDSLALELAPFGIHVVAIEPGAIRSDWATIASENLLKASGEGPYAKQAHAKAESFEKLYKTSLASDADVVARGVVRILRKKNPAFRYAIGGGAELLMALRKILPDRVFYFLLGLVMG